MSTSLPRPEHERVASFLGEIPGPRDNAVKITDLCARCGLDLSSAQAVLTLVRTFGQTVVVDEAAGRATVRAANDVTWYFLKSLAEYVSTEDEIFANWSRLTARQETQGSTGLPPGPRLLYLMEKRRIERHKNALHLREVEVAQVIINAGTDPRHSDVYLVKYDDEARDFQLIGGHRRDADADLRETAVHELERILPAFRFTEDSDTLRQLGRVQVLQVSHTYGVVTRYDVELFHLRTGRQELTTPPTAKWVTADALLADTYGHGDFNVTALRQIIQNMGNNLSDLPKSLLETPKTKKTIPTGTNLWEIIGVIIGIVGILISIVFFFLS